MESAALIEARISTCLQLFFSVSPLSGSACWSIDARRSNWGQPRQVTYFVGASTVAYILLIMIVYIYNAITKTYVWVRVCGLLCAARTAETSGVMKIVC